MRILITRPEPDASAFAAMCQAAGYEPVLAPLMETVFDTPSVDLKGVGAIAFTSSNGVRAFSRVSNVKTLPVFAVGEATAAEAAQQGFQNIKQAGGDVSSLSSLVADNKSEFAGDVLHIAGARRAGDLVAALKELNLPARRVVLYEMKEAALLPSAALPAPEWVTFFSPRTAALFVRLAMASNVASHFQQTKLACLSEAVAEEAASMRWRSVHVAKRRNSAAMITLIGQSA